MKTTINEFDEEFARLCFQAERLHHLFTAKIGESWSGDAFDACLRESRDNDELALRLVNRFKSVKKLIGTSTDPNTELPSDILL